MAALTYGDITPRTAAYAATRMLTRAFPALCMAKFGQMQSVPKGKSKTVTWRRYNKIAVATAALTEGVTPSATSITNTDVSKTLAQYGDRAQITDVILDTHEDPILSEFSDILGEAAGETKETLVYNAIKGGTQKVWANGVAARNLVVTAMSANDVRNGIRQLKRQNAVPITSMLGASTGVGTLPIPPCYVCFIHPDIERDLQAITGYIRVQNYGTWKPLGDNEVGSFENVRFLSSTLCAAEPNAGGAKGLMISTGGVSADVYLSLMVAKDAYATVALAGAESITPMVVNPKPSDSDPLGQRGHIAYKFYHAAAILNDAFMTRLETAATA